MTVQGAIETDTPYLKIIHAKKQPSTVMTS